MTNGQNSAVSGAAGTPVLRLDASATGVTKVSQDEALSLLSRADIQFQTEYVSVSDNDPDVTPSLQTSTALYPGLEFIKLFISEVTGRSANGSAPPARA